MGDGVGLGVGDGVGLGVGEDVGSAEGAAVGTGVVDCRDADDETTSQP